LTKKTNKKTTEQYKQELEEYNLKYDTNIKLKEGVEYIGANTKILHTCTCGKDWLVSPSGIINRKSKSSCGLCYTFAEWGIDNLGEDFLKEYWDYEKNNELGIDPWKINYNNYKKFYIFCRKKNYHGSYQISGSDFIRGNRCSYCKGQNSVHPKDSFGQFLIDSFGVTALELYWDYDKNTIDPFKYTKYTNRKVWIKCQEKDYHGSYDILCGEFISGGRCGYCNSRVKVHKYDSLGYLYPQTIEIWSDKNNKSPYEYTPGSSTKVWWKCKECKHEDYPQIIYSAKNCNFGCPECVREKVESRMATTLKQVFKHEDHDTKWEYDIGFRTDKNGVSKYDIYVPRLNLLIECQSEYHDDEIHMARDKLKKQFAIDNKYNYIDLDHRDYSPLEAIQMFFPYIKEMPEYIDDSKNTRRDWDVEEAQRLLDNGYNFDEVAEYVGATKGAISYSIWNNILIKPDDYHQTGTIKIICLSKDYKFVKQYNSVRDATKDLGLANNSAISSCLTKRIRSDTNKVREFAKGYRWMYLVDYENMIKKDDEPP